MLSQTYLDNIEYTIFLCRSSPPEVFCKKGVLKNFTKFTEKHLCQSLFLNKDAALRPVTLLKKRLWHRYFPVNFAKFLRAPFLTEPVWATASVCNVFPAWQTQHCIGYFAKTSFLSTMDQYYRGNSLAQCWPTKIRITMQIIFLCKVVHRMWVSIAQVTFLCNTGTCRLR